MKYYNKLVIVLLVTLFCACIVQSERTKDAKIYQNSHSKSVVKMNNSENESDAEFKNSNEKMIIIYDNTSEKSLRYKINMSKSLSYMKVENESIDITKLQAKDYKDMDCVILAVDDLDNKANDKIYELIDYAKSGGKLIIGIVPKDIGNVFNGIYRMFGITESNGYTRFNGIHFNKELTVGMNHKKISDKRIFEDFGINLRLDETCTVYMESLEKQIPIFWTKDLEKGKVGFYNAGTLGERGYEGVFAGVVASMQETFLYPIINAKVIFLDDFPAPVYNVKNDIVKKSYNRTIKEFYRDIWWPDMQKVAKKYNVIYTGLFVSTYNSIVDPKKFVYENDPMMEYYGDALLKNGYELGLHGYNHQSLAMKGEIPKEEHYNSWKSQEDMELSLKALYDNGNKLFKGCKFTSYVPPSNYLSVEGRKALYNALPDLKIISGVYKNDLPGVVYVQDFEIAKDGIAEFPRITYGMWDNEECRFAYMNGLSFYGVFSHFIHPDDVLDKERGRGAKWEKLLKEYTNTLEGIKNDYSKIRSLKATEAADALKVYEDLEINIKYSDNNIKGKCNNFNQEAFFYLRSEKKPITVDESCEISKMDKKDGEYYYFVKVKTPEFTIKLEK